MRIFQLGLISLRPPGGEVEGEASQQAAGKTAVLG